MTKLTGQMKPAYGHEPGQPGEEQANATHESRKAQLEREIPDLERYLEVLKAELRELTGEVIVGPH